MIWSREKSKEELEIEAKQEKLLASISRRLDNPSEWKRCNDEHKWNLDITHVEMPISINDYCISEPEFVKIPRRWKKEIKSKIKAIVYKKRVEDFNFLCELFDGVYPTCFQIKQRSEENQEKVNWLKETATTEQYFFRKVRHDRVYCFITDEELAMAFKLKFS